MNPVLNEALSIAAQLCMVFEGYSSKPYICPAGYWTIGYGHRCSKDQPEITRKEAELILRKDLLIAATAALRYCPVLAHSDAQYLAAVIDWTFNLGGGRLRGSTFRRRIGLLQWIPSAYECRRWVNGGGKRLRGLVKRRAVEVRLLAYKDPRMADLISRFDSTSTKWVHDN